VCWLVLQFFGSDPDSSGCLKLSSVCPICLFLDGQWIIPITELFLRKIQRKLKQSLWVMWGELMSCSSSSSSSSPSVAASLSNLLEMQALSTYSALLYLDLWESVLTNSPGDSQHTQGWWGEVVMMSFWVLINPSGDSQHTQGWWGESWWAFGWGLKVNNPEQSWE
jgi:hypothetical protein